MILNINTTMTSINFDLHVINCIQSQYLNNSNNKFILNHNSVFMIVEEVI